MSEIDYKILVHFVRYAEQIEYFTNNHFKGKLEVFRNRPRTPRVTMPKAVCLLFTYKLSACAEHLSEELKNIHPEVPWEKIANLRQTIITREEGFFNPEAAWEVLTVDIPAWDKACCSILAAHNPNFGEDVAKNHYPSRFAKKD